MTTPEPPAQPADALPTREAVRHLVGDLVGHRTTVDPVGAPLGTGEAALVAEYADEDGSLVVLALCDADFANRVGAALTTVPGALADHATHAGRVSPMLLESTEEVLNVLASLLATSTTRHVRLRAVHDAAGGRRIAEAAVAGARARCDVALDVEGYGACRVALLLA
jgi:hypothetical protein